MKTLLVMSNNQTNKLRTQKYSSVTWVLMNNDVMEEQTWSLIAKFNED